MSEKKYINKSNIPYNILPKFLYDLAKGQNIHNTKIITMLKKNPDGLIKVDYFIVFWNSEFNV